MDRSQEPCEVESITDIRRKAFDLITEKNLEGLKKHLDGSNLRVDLTDDHGMTLLTHAAYKGDVDIVQYLLDRGADVNTQKHEHGYTPLHFGALSGNPKMCVLLKDYGASNEMTNTVNRTPSQMAAFVGNHKCVAVINNYIPKSDIEYFTVPRGLETEPKLPSTCANSLHKLIMQINLHPIRVALGLDNNLLDDLPKVYKVLFLMSEKEMKKGPSSNEVLSFKLQYLAFITEYIYKIKAEKNAVKVDKFIKKILSGDAGNKFLDLLLCDSIRSFNYPDSTLLRQMVSSLVKKEDAPSPLFVILTAINGHRMSEEGSVCSTCKEEGSAKKCPRCGKDHYCDRECQKRHWFVHKKYCAPTDEVSEEMSNVSIS